MPRAQRSRGLSKLVFLFSALSLTPAYALYEEVSVSVPSVHTVVTGRGGASSVAWPDGASMTPRWIVANALVSWSCGNIKAVELVVKTDKGPGSTPRTFELLHKYGLSGASTPLELYLWEVSRVKAACAKDGAARVDSVTVNLSLRCESGPVIKNKQVIPLQVDCQPSTPSQEAVTGISGSETERKRDAHSIDGLLKFSRFSADPSPRKLTVGETRNLEFIRLMSSVWKPQIQILRVVRLDEKGQVAERFQPVPLSGTPDNGEFRPQIAFTPKAAGTLRFALEAEYADGSRLLSLPAEVQALTPEQAAAEKAKEISYSRRMKFFEEMDQQAGTLDCGPKLVEWIKKQPIIQEAGIAEGDIWYRFIDGRDGSISCH